MGSLGKYLGYLWIYIYDFVSLYFDLLVSQIDSGIDPISEWFSDYTMNYCNEEIPW